MSLMGHRPNDILALSPLSRDPRYGAVFNQAKWPHEFGDELETLVSKKPDLVILASYTRPEWIRILDLAQVTSFVLRKFCEH